MNAHFKAAIEAVLFASGQPVSVLKIAEAMDMAPEAVLEIADRLCDEYDAGDHGIRFLKINENLQMVTRSEYADVVRRVLEVKKPNLSRPALETLSIVAYRQPVTKSYIDQVRGIDSAYTVNTLLEKGLIEECGRLDVPGRPRLLQTTDVFLRAFGLSSLDELPALFDKPDAEPLLENGRVID